MYLKKNKKFQKKKEIKAQLNAREELYVHYTKRKKNLERTEKKTVLVRFQFHFRRHHSIHQIKMI